MKCIVHTLVLYEKFVVIFHLFFLASLSPPSGAHLNSYCVGHGGHLQTSRTLASLFQRFYPPQDEA